MQIVRGIMRDDYCIMCTMKCRLYCSTYSYRMVIDDLSCELSLFRDVEAGIFRSAVWANLVTFEK